MFFVFYAYVILKPMVGQPYILMLMGRWKSFDRPTGAVTLKTYLTDSFWQCKSFPLGGLSPSQWPISTRLSLSVGRQNMSQVMISWHARDCRTTVYQPDDAFFFVCTSSINIIWYNICIIIGCTGVGCEVDATTLDSCRHHDSKVWWA